MGDWENLPMDLLSLIYTYLPRRDRLACSLVCKKWREGLDHVLLWKTIVVHVDTDLMEPSTIQLLRDYCRYIKNLEFGWAVAHRIHKWSPEKYKEITKRAVRFFLILHDNYTQINSLKLFNWFDFISFQKVTYHLSRFLRIQVNLQSIIFDNINLQSCNYMKLLTSCLGSKDCISTIDIRSCYYCQSSFDSLYFRSVIEQLTNLKTFKLDYFILSRKVISAILISGNIHLENLEIILNETSWRDQIIDDEQWVLLSSACPNLKVSLIIRNVYLYGELRLYLKQSIPLVSLSFLLPKILEKGGGSNFRKILNLLVANYYRSLESLDLHIRNENEIIDDVLLLFIRKCTKLKTFIFNGYLENPQEFKNTFPEMTHFCMLSCEGEEKTPIFNRILNEDLNEMKRRRVQLTLLKRNENFYGDLQLYLKQSIPLVSLSFFLPKIFEKEGSSNFCKILNLLVTNYYNILESLDLNIRNENEIIDDVLLLFMKKCIKLKTFKFNGYLEKPREVKNIFPDMTHFCMLSCEGNIKSPIFKRILKKDLNKMKRKRVQLALLKQDKINMCSFLIIN